MAASFGDTFVNLWPQRSILLYARFRNHKPYYQYGEGFGDRCKRDVPNMYSFQELQFIVFSVQNWYSKLHRYSRKWHCTGLNTWTRKGNFFCWKNIFDNLKNRMRDWRNHKQKVHSTCDFPRTREPFLVWLGNKTETVDGFLWSGTGNSQLNQLRKWSVFPMCHIFRNLDPSWCHTSFSRMLHVSIKYFKHPQEDYVRLPLLYVLHTGRSKTRQSKSATVYAPSSPTSVSALFIHLIIFTGSLLSVRFSNVAR